MIATDFSEVQKKLLGQTKSSQALADIKKSNPERTRGAPRAWSDEQKGKIWDIRLELSPFVPEVILRLLKMIFNEGTDDKDRIKCIEMFLNRVYGKPTERVEISASDNVEDMSAKETYSRIMGIIDALPTGNHKKVAFKALTTERKMKNA